MARPRRDQNSRMLHVKDRQSFNFQFGAFTVLVFHTVVFLALIHSCTGQSEVIGPSQPIVAIVGEDIILPCYLDPVMNAFDMTVEWARLDLDPRFVLVWRDGVELESKKHPSYKGRTSVFTDELKHGNISLKLSKVKISDEGRYRCFSPALVRASTVQLVVGAVSSPVIQMTKNSSGVLECESKGWYPEPEVFWLDGEGHLLSAGPTETVRGPDDLYTVSSRVTVEKRHSNSFTCRVQQKSINQTRETHVHVPDHFFMVPSTPSTPGTPGTPGSPHVIIGSIIGCAALVAIPAVVFIVWKWRKKKCKNKRKSHEEGSEQTEEENRVVMEGEGESVPLMAGREEENNVDNRGEEKIESQSEHKDPQFVAERETHQDQLVTKPQLTRDMDRAEGERKMKAINNEKVPLKPTEGETHQKQDMIGRQVKNDRDKGEGERTMKPVKEDSGLPMVLVAEGQKEQPQNLHTDQEVQKEEETRQESMNDVDKKEAKIKKKRAKKENEQERVKEVGSGTTGQKKQQENQRERMQLEAERQREENERKLQSEMQKRKEGEKEEIELKPQKGNGSQHLLEDRKQEGSKAELEDKTEKGREGNRSNITTKRKAEDQKEQINEKLKETEEERVENERELQSERQEKIKRDKERTELKTQKGDGNQHVLDASKQAAEHEDKKGKDREAKQSDITRTTERKAENQKGEKRDERENKLPSVSREVTGKPDLKIYQETAGRQNQELQEEKQEEEKSQRNQEETKEQPEQSTKGVKVECKERREEGLENDKGADIDETQKKEIEKQLRQEGQQQAVQQSDVKEEVREQPEESFKFLTERGAECQEVLQEEAMEIDRRPETQRNVKIGEKRQRKQEKEVNVDQQQTVRKRRRQEEGREQTQKTSKKPKKGQNDAQMESEEEEANMEQEVIDEPQGRDGNSQLDQALMCQEDQQEEPMES